MTRQYDLDIQYFLATCLRMVAFLNNSPIAGIALDTVRKIDKIYSNKKQTLLQTVVLAVLRSCSKRLSFVDRYPIMSKLARIDIKDMDRSRQDLGATLKSVEADIEAIAAQKDSDASIEAFVAHMQQFVWSSREKLDEMNAEYEKMVSHTNRCLQYFGATHLDGFIASFIYMTDSVRRYTHLEGHKESIKQALTPLAPLNSPPQPAPTSRAHPGQLKKPATASSSQQPVRAFFVPTRQPDAGKENLEPPKKRPQLVRKKVEVDQKYRKREKETEAVELAGSQLSVRERETVNKSRRE